MTQSISHKQPITIGILGGGQLGRFLAIAAANLGLKTHIYCPEENAPAIQVANTHTTASYEDDYALKAFSDKVDVITYEFEHIPLTKLSILQEKLRPSIKALEITQDRIKEKNFLSENGLALARFLEVNNEDEFEAAKTRFDGTMILKTTTDGYDGKGQIAVRPDINWSDLPEDFRTRPLVAEERMNFAFECSLIATRSPSGETVMYDLVENTHQNHILKTTRAYKGLDANLLNTQAQAMAAIILETLRYIGTLSLEFFALPQPNGSHTLIINELAPRVHNSGHWTLDAAITSQFENHIRAIANLPLGSPVAHSDFKMHNLLGQEIFQKAALLQTPEIKLYDYGKKDAREGRKMGHYTELFPLQ